MHGGLELRPIRFWKPYRSKDSVDVIENQVVMRHIHPVNDILIVAINFAQAAFPDIQELHPQPFKHAPKCIADIKIQLLEGGECVFVERRIFHIWQVKMTIGGL